MRKSAFYYNRDGLRIQLPELKEKMRDHAYRVVRLFENDSVMAEINWTGLGGHPTDSLRDCWPLFEMRVFNKNSFGEWVPDPVCGLKTFPTERDAVEFYESFLIKWTDCESNEDGVFVEVGNEAEPIVPPPPPSPDQPVSKLDNILSDEGVW